MCSGRRARSSRASCHLPRIDVRDGDGVDEARRAGQVDPAPVRELGHDELGDLLQRRRRSRCVSDSSRPASTSSRRPSSARVRRRHVLGDVHDHLGPAVAAAEHGRLGQQPLLLARVAVDAAHQHRPRAARPAAPASRTGPCCASAGRRPRTARSAPRGPAASSPGRSSCESAPSSRTAASLQSEDPPPAPSRTVTASSIAGRRAPRAGAPPARAARCRARPRAGCDEHLQVGEGRPRRSRRRGT